jgi:GR25 family glycosyltransferase involved in LPS biosynthesis
MSCLVKTIPTYIINLKRRTDRKTNILKEFTDKKEFKISVVEAVEHKIGAIGLWATIRHILQDLAGSNEDYILICEDDHQFTDEYSNSLLFEYIEKAKRYKADILCGGVSCLGSSLQAQNNLFWTEQFTGAQFIILFKHFWPQIINAQFTDSDDADLKLSSLSDLVFFVYPFISVQKDYGYSDVTFRNNKPGRVKELFERSIESVKILIKLTEHYQKLKKKAGELIDIDENVIIPTYIINLPERTERREHIQRQFADKPEFDVTVISAIKNENGALGLWLTIRKVIKMAVEKDDDVIIICEDDHEFTNAYSKKHLLTNIFEAYEQGTEILCGGIGGFGQALPITKNRFWISSFFSTQYLILFRSIFEKILNEPFDNMVTADGILSTITSNKMTIFPFISIQKEFGYSDVTAWNNGDGSVSKWFIDSAARLQVIKETYENYFLIENQDSKSEEFLQQKN